MDILNIEVRPVHSAQYRAGPTPVQLAVAEINRMLGENVIEAATTKLDERIVFAPDKDGSLRFHVKYRKFNAVTIRNSLALSRVEKVSTTCERKHCSLRCVLFLGNGRSKFTSKTEKNYFNIRSWPLQVH